jgi:hypothetical protein
MGKEADHLALANKSHDVLELLLKEPEKHSEWIATVAFYKAVQLIDAACVKAHGSVCHGHPQRLDRVKTSPHLGSVFPHYRFLWNAPVIARYLYEGEAPHKGYSSFTDYIAAKDVEKRIVQKRLLPIEQHVAGLLTPGMAKILRRTGAS